MRLVLALVARATMSLTRLVRSLGEVRAAAPGSLLCVVSALDAWAAMSSTRLVRARPWGRGGSRSGGSRDLRQVIGIGR